MGKGLQIGKGFPLVTDMVARTTVHYPMKAPIEGKIRGGEEVTSKMGGRWVNRSCRWCEEIEQLLVQLGRKRNQVEEPLLLFLKQDGEDFADGGKRIHGQDLGAKRSKRIIEPKEKLENTFIISLSLHVFKGGEGSFEVIDAGIVSMAETGREVEPDSTGIGMIFEGIGEGRSDGVEDPGKNHILWFQLMRTK
ncbi:hypothetical protein F2P56_023950 [Juglans regia]|uniref:Uncharacterized protein n=1 Tax=Juglans regia TaxID=51240 RepID=A0A833UFL3_JUGRE|nr:hypothetical protein F2P56_023950 [Juglans regia]